MHLHRDRSRLSYRTRRRHAGLLPLAVILGVIVGILALSWDRIGQWLNFASTHQAIPDLSEAEHAFARGDLDTAASLTRAILADHPDDTDALIFLSRVLIYRSYTDYDHTIDRQIALELAEDAVNKFPDNSDLLAAHAYTLQATGQSVEASRAAARVLESAPDHRLARVALALSYGGVGAFDTALRENQNATVGLTQDDPWWLETQRALAITYSDLGRYQDALKTISPTITNNNRLIPLYFERALYALQIGDTDTATVDYFQVLALDAKNAKARLRLCELSSLLRERDAAIRYCEEVTEFAPSWADGWYQLGREYFLQGNFLLAQDHLHRCSSLQVMQRVPIDERLFDCWYLQGQAAEIVGDCVGLMATYNEFRAMAAAQSLDQTWVYPPEGPPDCLTSPNAGTVSSPG